MTIAFAIGRAIGKGLFPITDEKMMAAAKKGEEKRRRKAEKKAKKKYVIFTYIITNNFQWSWREIWEPSRLPNLRDIKRRYCFYKEELKKTLYSMISFELWEESTKYLC